MIGYKMDVFIILFCIYSLLASVRVSCFTCNEREKCPKNLPYCTPAGCVFSCPDQVFINGTNCVQDCHEEYIFNRSCVPYCPIGSTLIEENINFKFKKLRFCRSHCVHDMFKYNDTCIKSCPENLKFVEDGACVKSCKINTIHKKMYIDDRLVGIKCDKNCNNASNNPFQLSNECVSKCKENQVVFDGKCLEQCPKDEGFILNLVACIEMGKCVQGWPEQKYCSGSCPDNNYVYDSNCVAKCPVNAVYSFNGQCAEKCPKHKIYKYLKIGGVIECHEVCPYPSITFNLTCVQGCPSGFKTYNRTCVTECPNDLFVEESFNGIPICVKGCTKKYIYGNECRSSCPADAKYISDSYCLSECPKSKIYTFENSFTCLDKCPGNKKIYKSKYECVTYCPSGTSVHKRTCLDECPHNTYKQISASSGETICVNTCAKFRNNITCVDSCPKYSLNKTCLEKCPSDFKVIYGTSCYYDCPTETCLMDDGINCTEDCYLDTKRGQLVFKCPPSAPYNRRYFTEGHCVSACENHEVLEKSRCINVTECKRAVLSHGKCEDECPEGYLYTSLNNDDFVTHGYQYNVESVKATPCTRQASAYLATFSFGIITLMYWLSIIIFLSPCRINGDSCLSDETQVQCEKELNDHTNRCENLHLDASTAAETLQDEEHLNEEQLEDIPLINLATSGDIGDIDREHECRVDIHTDNNFRDDVPLLDITT